MSKIEAELKADFDKRQAAGEKVLATAEGQEPAEIPLVDMSPLKPKIKS